MLIVDHLLLYQPTEALSFLSDGLAVFQSKVGGYQVEGLLKPRRYVQKATWKLPPMSIRTECILAWFTSHIAIVVGG